MFVDELQYVKEEELAALITALRRAAQRRLPVVLAGAGLPQLRGRMGRAKSYAERLFDFPEIGHLPPIAARTAIAKPAAAEGVEVNEEKIPMASSATKSRYSTCAPRMSFLKSQVSSCRSIVSQFV